MIEVLLAPLIGLAIGAIAGLVPGLHPNTLIPIIAGLSSVIDPLGFGVLAVSIGIASNFFEFIKTTYFSVPDEGSVLAAQPVHELLLEGRGLEAVRLLCTGALGAVFIASIVLLPLYYVIPIIYTYVKGYVPMILALISAHFILREKKRIGWAALVFSMAGLVGFVVLKNDLMSEPLLSMLAGFYGASALIDNVGKDVQIPGQLRKVAVDADKKMIFGGVAKAIFAGSIITVVPAVGPAQASLLANEASKLKDKREYLVTIGGVNTADVIYSLIALMTINKARSGLLELVKKNAGFEISGYLIMILSAVIVGITSYFLVIKAAKAINKKISRVDYSKFSVCVLVFMCILVAVINGIVGLLVFAICAYIGRITIKKKVNKSHLLACLVVPTISYYL